MSKLHLYPVCILLSLVSFIPSAKTATYYSKGDLSIHLAASWSSTRDGSGPSPANFTGSNTWIIQSGDSMMLINNTAWSLTGSTLVIENGGVFMNATTSSSVTIPVFRIHGGGIYYHNSAFVAIPGGSKEFANSTNGGQGNGHVVIQNYPNATVLSDTFGHLTITHNNGSIWNMGGYLTTVEGDFTLNKNNSIYPFRLGSTSSTLTIGGDFNLLSGLFQVSNGSAGTYQINIGGNFYQSGGTFNPNTGASPVTINFTGSGKSFQAAAGTLTNNMIDWKVNQGASLSLLSDLPVAASRKVTVDGSLACGTNRVTGAGAVSVGATGTLALGSLSLTGALQDNIVATINSLPAGSTIDYNGAGVQHETSRTFQNLSVSNHFGLHVSNGNILEVKGDLVNSGLITGSGKVLMNDNLSPSNISGSGTISNLEVDNSNGVTIAPGSTVHISDVLMLTNGTLTTNDGLVLKSTSVTGTARVAPLGATAGLVGKVTVERFIPSRRAWRLLTAPVRGLSGNSILDNWQHGGGGNDGTGAEIWGPGGTGPTGNGLASTVGGSYSFRNYNAATNTWLPISDTRTEPLFNSAINRGLLTFITGPYGSGNIATGSAATTLKATGELITGTQTYTFNEQLALVGNPYPSPIDFDAVWNNSGNSNLARQFWVVDPNLNDIGGYVLVMHNGTGYSITPSGGGVTFQDQHIQNGQAFFVTGTTPGQVTMKIEEDDKATGASQTAVFRSNGGALEILRINLNAAPQNAPAVLIDGALVNGHENYSNSIMAGEDGAKFFNFNESISLIKNGSKYAIEGRPLLDSGDTIFIGLNGMRQRDYQLELVPAAFNAPGLSATLYDNYLNTSSQVSISSNTVYPFSVNGSAASGNDGRFFIVFHTTPLDALSLFVKAEEKVDGVHLNWEVSDDIHVTLYSVEKSDDGRDFLSLTTIEAGGQNKYVYVDQSFEDMVRFYRISARLQNGRQLLSRIVKVEKKMPKATIAVYPNPATGSQVQIKLAGLSNDGYSLSISNPLGQVVVSKLINASGGSSTMSVDLTAFPAGTYFVNVFDKTGKTVGEALLVKE